jgi:hypothetical protein
MTNQNPSGNGKFTGELGVGVPTRHSSLPSLAGDRCLSARFEPPRASQETATVPMAGKARPVDWQMVALWIFIGVSFAALAFTGYLLWAKCRL